MDVCVCMYVCMYVCYMNVLCVSIWMYMCTCMHTFCDVCYVGDMYYICMYAIVHAREDVDVCMHDATFVMSYSV